MKPLTTILVLLILCSFGSLPSVADEDKAIYISDLSICEPTAKLSKNLESNKWRLIDYKTEKVSGVMLGAASYVEATEVRLPLKQQGWFRVYLGIWNPGLMYDGKTIIKTRLSSRPIYQQIHPGATADTQRVTYIEEVFVCEEDLSDEQYMAFGKSNGLQPRSAYVAYVKLVPMTPEEIKREQTRRENVDRKNMVATYDGSSIFHYSECTTMNDQLEWIEKLRHSDIKKVLWAVTYGDKVTFPTENPTLNFVGNEDMLLKSSLTFGNDYQRGQRQRHNFFKRYADENIISQQLLAEHAHALGLKFDLMYRLGILGGLGLSELHKNSYLDKHPEVRQVTRAGHALQKASMAFPEVQQLILDQIEESLRVIDADGINLCYVRGPHFLLWEKPVRDAFEAKYGVSSKDVEDNDPRIKVVRAEIITSFMKRVRATADKIGAERKRKLTVSVWVWPHDQGVWLGSNPMNEGLNVEEWIRQGLLDSVICQEGIDKTYIELGKKHGCEFVLFTGYRGEKNVSPTSILNAQKEGVGAFAYWDIDVVQNDPRTWRWLSQTGNADRLTRFKENDDLLKRKLIPLKEINGISVAVGLVDAVYSGG